MLVNELSAILVIAENYGFINLANLHMKLIMLRSHCTTAWRTIILKLNMLTKQKILRNFWPGYFTIIGQPNKADFGWNVGIGVWICFTKYCQAHSQLQVELSLKTELALISINLLIICIAGSLVLCIDCRFY